MPTAEFFREQAARCRRLARDILDANLHRRLLEIAGEFDKEAEALETVHREEPCPKQ